MEEIFFEDVQGKLVQGCTIRVWSIKNADNYYKLECITCNQVGYFPDEYHQGCAAGLHFADKEKYPIMD